MHAVENEKNGSILGMKERRWENKNRGVEAKKRKVGRQNGIHHRQKVGLIVGVGRFERSKSFDDGERDVRVAFGQRENKFLHLPNESLNGGNTT